MTEFTAVAPPVAEQRLRAQTESQCPRGGIRVLMVDDDVHSRQRIARALHGDPRVHLAGQAESLAQARKLLGNESFQVLLVDLELGDGSGLDLIAEVRAAGRAIEIIVISALGHDEAVMRALSAGAVGFLFKGSATDNYAQAIVEAVNGGSPITPLIARRLLKHFQNAAALPLGRAIAAARPLAAEVPIPRFGAPQAREELTEREQGIIRKVALGYTNTEIATQFAISVHTVNTHVKNVYRKLQVRTRAQATKQLALLGLV
ncbi:response regulator transcription factor [Piscinibacterium candidicorallinum]|uniref:Response regulator n=1 Tax=Piscinibacterium candidicorallinum TaxID=1793872 RepID=A0ABV7GZM9_9BURK